MSTTVRPLSAHYSTKTDHSNFPGYEERLPNAQQRRRNPIADVVSDEVYDALCHHELINERALRDYLIRRAYQKARKELHLDRSRAIDYVLERFPYLQMDTVRKIVYRVHSGAKKSLF